jgi:hypothetical protein
MDFNFILFTMPKDTLWTKHKAFVNFQILQSEGPESTRICTLSKMLPASIINASLQTAGQTKNMGDTILRGAHIKVATLGSNDSPKEWT